MSEITILANADQLDKVQAFIEERMEYAGFTSHFQNEISLVVEEVFVNIANYAYETEGIATIRCTAENTYISMEFLDNGRPYNPLANRDPDITLSAKERALGGLGIFIVKNIMDEVRYRRENGQNILSMRKSVK
ncbi:MAG: ATP-binding protein [Clostridiales Family XIII bacterium]|nr:ATP-binding protein [Clostridiales Family XIII bacterium]